MMIFGKVMEKGIDFWLENHLEHRCFYAIRVLDAIVFFPVHRYVVELNAISALSEQWIQKR